MRHDFIGCAGNGSSGSKGSKICKCIFWTPLCIPASASIMTGLEGEKIGLTEYKERFE